MLNQRGFALEKYSGFEILDYPKALADANSYLKKLTKSSLMAEIETRSNCKVDITELSSNIYNKIYLFDGMTVIYLLQLNKFSTFGDFATAFYKYVTSYL